MRLYRGRIGAILIATLLTGAAALALQSLFGKFGSQRDLTIFLILVLPCIVVSALIGIVALMIPVEARVRRSSTHFAPVGVIIANCVLVWLVLLFTPASPQPAPDLVLAVMLGVPAAMLWLAVDRLYRKAFSNA